MTESPGGRRRLAAVWFADIVGYTTLSAENEDAALEVVGELQRIAKDAVEARDGRVVKFIGDAVLTVFDSAESALHAALAVQVAFNELELADAHDVALRIGMHLGEVMEAADGDVYGDGVNIASRVEGAAQPGQVAVTEAVQSLIRNRPHFLAEPLGEHPLKGIAAPVPLYAVTLADAPAMKVRRRTVQKPSTPGRALGVGTGAAIIAFLSLSIFVAQRGAPDGSARTDTVTIVQPGEAPESSAGGTSAPGNPDAEAAAGGGPAAGAADPVADGGRTPGTEGGPSTDQSPESETADTGTPAAPEGGRASATGLWKVEEGTDLLDDSPRISLSLASARGSDATLVIDCRARRLGVQVTWGTTLTDAALRVRLDGGRDRDDRSQWTLLPDSTGVSYRGDPRRFLRELLSARTWVAAAHARSGDRVAQFSLRGLEAAGAGLREGCGWP